MLYHQKQYPFYNPVLIKISIGGYDLTVNYVELLDQSCVEFPHVHDCYEIYYCLSGNQRLYIDGSVHTLLSGHFAIIRPRVQHHTIYEPNSPKRYLVFVFTAPAISLSKSKGTQTEGDFLFKILKCFETHPHYIEKDKFRCENIISRMEREMMENYLGHQQMLSAMYQEYIISVFRNIDPIERAKNTSSNINLAIQITKYMHTNYYKSITIQHIADVFYISPRHVNRVFEEYFGESFKRTLNIYRLNYAKNYLMDTDYSAEKVSSLVGFSSPKMLYQLFRSEEGMTVAEYRKLQQAARAPIPYSETADPEHTADSVKRE